MIFDKTRTLTQGIFGVTRFQSLDPKESDKDILRLAAALEQQSEHLIAEGIVSKAKELGLAIPRFIISLLENLVKPVSILTTGTVVLLLRKC